MARPKVQPIAGEMLRFWVDSLSHPEAPHLVDLQNYWFNGQCDCEAFIFTHQPKLRRGQPPSDGTRCSHIKAARSYFMDEILPKLWKEFRPGDRGQEGV